MAVLGPAGRHRHGRPPWPRDGSSRSGLGSTGLSADLNGVPAREIRPQAYSKGIQGHAAAGQPEATGVLESLLLFLTPTVSCAILVKLGKVRLGPPSPRNPRIFP